jgi:hypothetical protein
VLAKDVWQKVWGKYSGSFSGTSKLASDVFLFAESNVRTKKSRRVLLKGLHRREDRAGQMDTICYAVLDLRK